MAPMIFAAIAIQLRTSPGASIALASLVLAISDPALAAGCAFGNLGEGRVAEVTDARSFRLEDGREVRLAGIEPVTRDTSGLSAMLAGKDVTLSGDDDAPDRYGRQSAFVTLASSGISVQEQLLGQGMALVSAEIADKECAAVLTAAETTARQAKLGAWARAAVIKSAESSDDILAGIGRFVVVEGTVLSVRQAGATTYLNFGRNWTRGFAVTISRRVLTSFEAVGISVKSLENKRIRVRGWVEAHGGPRIEALRAGQIELVGEN